MTEIDTGTNDLVGRIDQGVGVLTMNRPERRNAMSGAMTAALARALGQFEVDDEVGCVVLTGAGGAFCAGGDVKGMAERNDNGGRGAGRAETRRSTMDESIHLQRLNQRATAGRLYEMPKPTIAALPGAAAGAGLSLALACDLRYSRPRLPGSVSRGTMAEPGSSPVWLVRPELASSTTSRLGFRRPKRSAWASSMRCSRMIGWKTRCWPSPVSSRPALGWPTAT